MKKKEFGPQPWIFPNPGDPPTLSVGVRHQRHTLKGIYQNMAFSVNVPSVDLLAETDYCGLVSGTQVDKVKKCNFKVFYGTLAIAPLIEECPVNLECEVVHLLNVGIHMLVVGKIVQTHVSEDCLTDGQPDILKIKPFVYSRGTTARYNAVGEVIGQAFDAGKKLKKG